MDNLVSVVWRPFRETKEWAEAARELPWMFSSRPLVGKTTMILERFVISRVWRQYGQPQDISQGYYAYARLQRDVERGWPPQMDLGRTLIDVRSLAAVQWDYLPEVADAGMTPAYQAYLIAHPFPQFTDPAGMGRQAQRQVPLPQGEQPQA